MGARERRRGGAGPAGWGRGPGCQAGPRSYRGQSARGAWSQLQPQPEPEPAPAPPCPWPSAAARTTRPPTGWTRASSTTVASWTRSTWCRMSSCSSSPSPSSSSVSARGERRRRGGRGREGGGGAASCRSWCPLAGGRSPLASLRGSPALCDAPRSLRSHLRAALTTGMSLKPHQPQRKLLTQRTPKFCHRRARAGMEKGEGRGSLSALERSGGGRAVLSQRR